MLQKTRQVIYILDKLEGLVRKQLDRYPWFGSWIHWFHAQLNQLKFEPDRPGAEHNKKMFNKFPHLKNWKITAVGHHAILISHSGHKVKGLVQVFLPKLY